MNTTTRDNKWQKWGRRPLVRPLIIPFFPFPTGRSKGAEGQGGGRCSYMPSGTGSSSWKAPWKPWKAVEALAARQKVTCEPM